MTPGSASSDDSGDDEVEDITYTGSGSNYASASQPSYNENWRSFDDDSYNSVNEMARGMMIQPPNNDDDSDDSDEDSDDDEPRLW